MRAEGWVAGLRRFMRPAPRTPRCELCGIDDLPEPHAHLVEPGTRQLMCACAACALIHADREPRNLRRVPDRGVRLEGLRFTEEQWATLGVPVGMAFFFRDSREDRVIALYPGAAGAMESLLDLSAWREIEEANPVLKALEPDVEALLVDRLDGASDYYRMPIDRCYALVGLIRSSWSGFTGGDGPREAVARFFAEGSAHP